MQTRENAVKPIRWRTHDIIEFIDWLRNRRFWEFFWCLRSNPTVESCSVRDFRCNKSTRHVRKYVDHDRRQLDRMCQLDKGCVNLTRSVSTWQRVCQLDKECVNLTLVNLTSVNLTLVKLTNRIECLFDKCQIDSVNLSIMRTLGRRQCYEVDR